MDIYNAWFVLFEIFDLQRAFALGKPGRRRNNEFLNIRLVRMYKRTGCWRSIYCENCVSIFVSIIPHDTMVVSSEAVLNTIVLATPDTKANGYFHD